MKRTIVTIAMVSGLCIASQAHAAEASASLDLQARIKLSIQLPTLTYQARTQGVAEADIKAVLDTAAAPAEDEAEEPAADEGEAEDADKAKKEKKAKKDKKKKGAKDKVGAADVAQVFALVLPEVEKHGPVENFGAFVQAKLDEGLRGEKLAAAIRKEHESKGIGQGKKLGEYEDQLDERGRGLAKGRTAERGEREPDRDRPPHAGVPGMGAKGVMSDHAGKKERADEDEGSDPGKSAKAHDRGKPDHAENHPAADKDKNNDKDKDKDKDKTPSSARPAAAVKDSAKNADKGKGKE